MATGYLSEENGKWYARLDYRDEAGEKRRIRRLAENKSQAKLLLKELVRRYDDQGHKSLSADRMSFSDLADFFHKRYLIAPQYVDGRKVAGLRSYEDGLAFLRALRAFFDKRWLRSITHGDIENFKANRLSTPTVHGKARAIASVNRELALLRRMLNVAQREGWIARNPFNSGDALINPADEKKREKIITFEEEMRLLSACTDKRAHLKPIIICALDTGMRSGEIFKLKWSDIDFENKLIVVKAFNTKTMRERTVGITPRLEKELCALYEASPHDLNQLVFGITDTVKKSFASARKAAGIPDVRFHDLRHTAATRLVQAHIPLSEVGRALGHTQPSTTYRYVNANVETARRIADALAAFSGQTESEDRASVIQ
jgi:integrase